MRIEINRKNMKNLRIRAENGIIKISAPQNMSYEKIMEIYNENKKEIENLAKRDMEKKTYDHKLFGEDFESDLKGKALEDFYREKFYQIIPEISRKYEEMTGLYAKEYRVRKMKARWGTCYPERGLIILALNLAKRPIDEIESVVLHEIIHLKYKNHSKDFYREIEKYMPDYFEIHKRLNS